MSPTWHIRDGEDAVLLVEDATVAVVGGALHIQHRYRHADGGLRTVERWLAPGFWVEAWTEYS
jgi:hypothetical protein